MDGLEATERIARAVKGLGGDAVLLDGVTYCGFDVVDPWRVHDETGLPVIVVQAYPINMERISRALSKHFEDHALRFNVIKRVYEAYAILRTRWRVISFLAIGIDRDEASKIIDALSVYSPIPEPLRIAGMIASSVSRLLLSRGGLVLPAGSHHILGGPRSNQEGARSSAR